MTYKSNIAPGSRSFFVSPNGDNNLSGLSPETAIATITEALIRVADLVPPSSLTDLSSIQMGAAGTLFEDDLVFDEGCQFTGLNTIIIAATGDGVTTGDSSIFNVGQMVTVGTGKKCFILENAFSRGIQALGTSTTGANSFGVHISGTGLELYITVDQMSIAGVGSVGWFNGCDEGNPVVGHINNFILESDNTTAFLQDHATLNLTKTIMSVISIVEKEGTTLTGTRALDIQVGEVDAVACNIVAETAIYVASGATLSLICSCVHGNIVIEAGGILHCQLPDHHSGTVTNLGEIHGRIGDKLYGDQAFTGDITLEGLAAERLKIRYQTNGDPINNVDYAQIITDLAGNLRFASRTNSASDLIFYTNTGVAAIERLHIHNDGRLTAGTIGGEASAIFDLFSTTRGFLPPRMTTTQRDAISTPASGLTIYNTTENLIEVYNGTTWTVGSGAGDVSGPLSSIDNAIARFDTTSGKIIQGSSIIIDDSDNITGVNDLTAVGVISGDGSGLTSVAADTATTAALALEASNLISFAVNNTKGGSSALIATTGSNNTGIGTNAAVLNEAGSNNTAIGSGALASNIDQSGSTCVGRDSMTANTTGDNNTAVGNNALKLNQTGNLNTVLGSEAARDMTGSQNVVIGYKSNWDDTGGNSGISIGVESMELNTGDFNVALGFRALRLNTLGIGNTAIGTNAGNNITTGSNNICIGDDVDTSSDSASNETIIGNGLTQSCTLRGVLNSGVAHIVELGVNVEPSDSQLEVLTNTAAFANFGVDSGIQIHMTTATADPAFFTYKKDRGGAGVLQGDKIGEMRFAGFDGTQSQYAATVGAVVSGIVIAGTLPTSLIFKTGSSGSGTERMRIDHDGRITMTDDLVVSGIITGDGSGITGAGDSNLNTAANYSVGVDAFSSTTGSGGNVAVGPLALRNLTNGTDNIAIGQGALDANTIGDSNIAIGTNALGAGVGDNNNLAIGFSAGLNFTVSGIIAIGSKSQELCTTGQFNTSMGIRSLQMNQTGEFNTGIGFEALRNTTSDHNFGLGYRSLLNNVGGARNIAIGHTSMQANVSGTDSIAIGHECLLLATGLSNIAIGTSAGSTTVTGIDNILIGKSVTASSSSASEEINIGDKFKFKNGQYIFNDAQIDEDFVINTNGKADTFKIDGGTGSVFIDDKLFVADGAAIGSITSFDVTSILDVQSTSKGLLIPRMTETQRDAIASPTTSLELRNTTTGQKNFYNGSSWDVNAIYPANTIVISKDSEWPTTFLAGKHYLITAPITVTAGNEATIENGGNVTIEGSDRINVGVTYTGTTGTLFTTTAMTGSLTINNLGFTGNGNSTRWCNLVASGFPGLTMDKCNFNGWGAVSILDSFGGGIAIGKIQGSGNAAGIFSVIDSVFFGVENAFFQNFSDTSSNFFTIDSLTSRVSMTLTGVACQPNENAFLINSSFTGEFIIQNVFAIPNDQLFDAAGLDGTSIYVDVNSVSNQPDSTTSAELFLTGNTATTAIPATGAMVEINVDVNWTDDSEQMTVNTDGSIVLDSLSPVKLGYSGNINLEPSTASKSISIRTVDVTPTIVVVTFTNGTNLINETATVLVNGDTISFRDTAGTLPAELRTDIVYFVVSQLTNSFQVSYVSGGAAIAFTDDGSGTNSYKVATLEGATPTNTITASSPLDLIPQAAVPMVTNSKAFLVVINNDDAVDIKVNSGYQKYSS